MNNARAGVVRQDHRPVRFYELVRTQFGEYHLIQVKILAMEAPITIWSTTNQPVCLRDFIPHASIILCQHHNIFNKHCLNLCATADVLKYWQ